MKKCIQIIIITLCSTLCATEHNGFCSVPIADLIGAPIGSFFKTKDVQQAYAQIPYGDKRGDFGCPRIAQLLLHEPVIILENKGSEVKIRVPHLQYPTEKSMHDTYWTLASNITKLTPAFKKALPTYHPQHTVTLRKPVYNPETKQIYCAGTQFLKTNQVQTKTQRSVYVYDETTNQMIFAHIPAQSCLDKPKTKKDTKRLVLELCKEWAHQKKGCIPYVFGGTTVSQPVQEQKHDTLRVSFTKKPVIFYERSPKPSPRAGLDCARMFTRALQMAGIPFYATNTQGFKEALQPLKPHEKIEAGDFILWKGHIAMISDVKKGLHIEARSYDDGYGKVHEIPLSEQLQKIYTVDDLKEAYLSKKRLTRLNKDGKKSHFIYDIGIFKLSSAWSNT